MQASDSQNQSIRPFTALMEIQTGPTSPDAPIVSVDEDALVSQVLEIIGGNAAEALTTLGEAEEGQEEGDDSVFLSDDDQGDSGDGKQMQDLQPPEAEDQSEAADQEAEQDRNAELSLHVEAELKNPAEPGEVWCISNQA